MIRLIYAEYYKMLKNKSLYSIILLSSVPIIFGIMVFLDLDAMKIQEGAFNLISFPDNMWQFLLGTSLPILVLSYLSSSLGRELKNGSLIYQVTRVANRKKIIYSKIWTIVSLNLFYFILFNLVAMLAYLVFISGTRFAGELIMDAALTQQLVLGLFGLLIQLTFCILSFLLSFKLSTIGLVIFSFVATTLISLLSSVEAIHMFIPGSVFYASHLFADGQFETALLLQTIVLIVLSIGSVVAGMRLFSKISV